MFAEERGNAVFILGLDELKYKIIAENELENLKQKEYGKLKLPRQETVWPEIGNLTPYTPFAWSPIETDTFPKKTGITGTWCSVCQVR